MLPVTVNKLSMPGLSLTQFLNPRRNEKFLRQRRQKAYEVIIFLSRAMKFVQIYSIHPPSSAADNQHWIIWKKKVLVGKFRDRKLPKLASISRGNRCLKSVYWSDSLVSSNILIKSSSQLEESVYSFSLFSHEWKWDEKTFSPCEPTRKSFPSGKILFPSKHRRERIRKTFHSLRTFSALDSD